MSALNLMWTKINYVLLYVNMKYFSFICFFNYTQVQFQVDCWHDGHIKPVLNYIMPSTFLIYLLMLRIKSIYV